LLLNKRAKENIKQDRKENKRMQLHGFNFNLLKVFGYQMREKI